MIVAQIRAQRVLPVLRLPSAAEATSAATAMFEAGLTLVELTATTVGWQQALHDTVRAAPAGAGVGLGTVTTPEIAEQAIGAGARFLVSPWPVPAVRAVAQAAEVPLIEGGFTPAELAASAGRGPTKLFPAHVGGTRYLQSMLAVLPGATLIPTGGIALSEVPQWLRAGAAAVGIGNDLLRPGADVLLRDLLAEFDQADSVQNDPGRAESGQNDPGRAESGQNDPGRAGFRQATSEPTGAR